MKLEESSKSISKDVDLLRVKYIISDWDGTLVNSMQAYATSFAETIGTKFNIDRESLKSYFQSTAGRPLSQQIKQVLERFANVEIEDTKELEEIFWQNLNGMKPEILPGAKKFLTALKQKRLRIIIWSGTRTDILKEKINLLSFSTLVDYYIGNVPGDEALVKGPGLFRLIAEKFGITPKELASKSLVLGDGIGDIEAGKAVGAITAAFRLENSNADFVFNNYSQIINKLQV